MQWDRLLYKLWKYYTLGLSDHHLPQKFYFWWWLYSVSKTWETWRQKNPNWFRTLCLSINGLWIAFHWRGRGYHNIHFLLMSKLACVSPMFILQSTNTTSLSIYNKYTIYTYIYYTFYMHFSVQKISIDWCCGWHFN